MALILGDAKQTTNEGISETRLTGLVAMALICLVTLVCSQKKKWYMESLDIVAVSCVLVSCYTANHLSFLLSIVVEAHMYDINLISLT